MEKKENEILNTIMITIVPSAMFTALYIILGMFIQNIPSMFLFVLLAFYTLFPFEIGYMLHANKNILLYIDNIK